ncbi:aminotransferase class IV [Salinactinospora qingdaonensis]|uniref:aminotransferase class IV n=1 Tax=Salinactinospora qingdaonensis TaxID=702744 RepID=UPI0031ED919F
MESAAARRLYWVPGAGLRTGAHPRSPILVADSWLVSEGKVRALERHRDRFSRSCADAGADEDTVCAFWEAAVGALPRSGAWFPRVELLDGERFPLSLLIRPAPQRGPLVRVHPWRGADPRRRPRVKGPDLAALAEVREQASRVGAEEALLLSPSGLVTDSTASALLWWDNGELCVPSPHLDVLPSVTAGLLTEQARERGVRVNTCYYPLDHLDGRETWLVNALAGIRVVSEWRGSEVRPGPAPQAQQWRDYLESLRRPLPETGPRAG